MQPPIGGPTDKLEGLSILTTTTGTTLFIQATTATTTTLGTTGAPTYQVKNTISRVVRFFEMKQVLPIIQGGNNNGYYNDKSGQCPYSNDRGYGGGLEWGGYGPVSNNIL